MAYSNKPLSSNPSSNSCRTLTLNQAKIPIETLYVAPLQVLSNTRDRCKGCTVGDQIVQATKQALGL
jgi:hypothetical protein